MVSIVQSLVSAGSYEEYESHLTRALSEENECRRAFAEASPDSLSPCLSDSHHMLLPLSPNESLFVHRVRWPEEQSVPRVFALDSVPKAGSACACSLSEFRRNLDVLSEGMLRCLDWSNVVLAGGSVNACLMPVPSEWSTSRKKLRQYFHDEKFAGIDLDLFLYGLDEKSAECKLNDIAQSLETQVAFPLKFFRTTHSITIVSRYPFVNVQLILRLYRSPAEVIMGFDVDSSAVLYDGSDVYCLPRSFHALSTKSNTVDMSRRSPTYESRLAKYASRGFEVLVPTLRREEIDPVIYEHSFAQTQGLSRLLLLERFKDPDERIRYILQKDASRGRGMTMNTRQLLGNSYMRNKLMDMGDRISDYSTVFFPWGPNWDCERIARLLHQKDHLLNSAFYTGESKPYHQHPCFISETMPEVLESGCAECPPFPENDSTDLKDRFVHGRVSFVLHNAGQQQQIGSFHPITEGDWSEGTYLNESGQAFVSLVVRGDVETLEQFLESSGAGFDVNTRDSLNRTALHLAVYRNDKGLVEYLLKHGASIDVRMTDGRTVFHLACIYDHWEILSLLLSHRESLGVESRCSLTSVESAYSLSALDLATFFLSEKCVSLLLAHGVEAKSVLSSKSSLPKLPSICLSGFQSSELPEKADLVIGHYLDHGVTSYFTNPSNSSHQTIFHWSLGKGFLEMSRSLYRRDPACASQLRMLPGGDLVIQMALSPFIHPEVFRQLLDWGAPMVPSQDLCDNTNKWLNSFPKDSYNEKRYVVSNITPGLILLVSAINHGKDVAPVLEMLEYAKSKCELDFGVRYGKKKMKTASWVVKNLDERVKCRIEKLEMHLSSRCISYLNSRNRMYSSYCRAVVEFEEEYLATLEASDSGSYGRFIYDTVMDFKSKCLCDVLREEELQKKLEKQREFKSSLEKLYEYLTKNGSVLDPSWTPSNGYDRGYDSRSFNTETRSGFQLMRCDLNNQYHGPLDFAITPSNQAANYLRFYDAVWRNDPATILALGSPDASDPVLVSSHCPLGLNPIVLALYRGHDSLVPLLLDLAIAQYTPPKTVKVFDDRPLSNMDILNGSTPDSLVSNAPDAKEDFSSLKSLVEPFRILFDICDLVFVPRQDCQLSEYSKPNGTSKWGNNSYSYFYRERDCLDDLNARAGSPFIVSALSYAISRGKSDMVRTLLDSVIRMESDRSEKLHQEIPGKDSWLYHWMHSNPVVDYDCFRDALRSGSVETVRLMVERTGCFYWFSDPVTDRLETKCCMHSAVKYGNAEILSYLTSAKVREDLSVFQDRYNPMKDFWEKNQVVPKICVQFSVDFGRKSPYDSETVHRWNYSSSSGGGQGPVKQKPLPRLLPLLVHASRGNNESTVRYLLEHDSSLKEPQLQEALDCSCNADGESVAHLLLDHGAHLSSRAIGNFLKRIPSLPNPYSSRFPSKQAEYSSEISRCLSVLDRLLGGLSGEEKRSLWSSEDTRALYHCFRHHLPAAMTLLESHGYPLDCVSLQSQNILHVMSQSLSSAYDFEKYLSSMFDLLALKDLVNRYPTRPPCAEDGFGEVPFEVFSSAFLKQIATESSYYNNSNTARSRWKLYLRATRFLQTLKPSGAREFVSMDSIRLCLKTNSELSRHQKTPSIYQSDTREAVPYYEREAWQDSSSSSASESSSEYESDDESTRLPSSGKSSLLIQWAD